MSSQSVNNDDFSHYADSAEKIENITKFFDKYFIANMVKIILLLVILPANKSTYNGNELSFYFVTTVIDIMLMIFSSYKHIYLKNPKKSLLSAISTVLLDGVLMFLRNGFGFFSISITSVSIVYLLAAIRNYLTLLDLKKLKGYPIFNELLDNPNYVLPKNIFHKHNNLKMHSIQAAINALPVHQSHVSVKLPDIPAKFPDTSSNKEPVMPDICYDVFPIPPAAETPVEARILGNASMMNYQKREYSYNSEKLTEINKVDEKRKKINLSKEGKK